jgi:ABC-2 type transport system ATP-binding protein
MTIEVKNLTKVFGKTVAVDDLSMSFSGGEILGFVGPNGSGKTTTMNILATLDEPTAGDVLADGMSVSEYPDKARRVIGFMPDYLPGQSNITVWEYLDFFARVYGWRGGELHRRVEEVIGFAGLEPIRDKTLAALSRGMKQRVSLARAMVHDPDVLIMDEPANGLDPRARIEFREYAKRLADAGKAVFISSHILADLNEICSGCVIIERGRLVKNIEGGLKGMNLEEVFLESTKGEVQ